MTERTKWQYCQIEVASNGSGLLRQFVADREPVEMQLYHNWAAMIGKLGDQDWELISVFPNEAGRGRSPLTYVFKRPTGSGTTNLPPAPPPPPAAPPPPEEPEQPQPPDFEPLRGV